MTTQASQTPTPPRGAGWLRLLFSIARNAPRLLPRLRAIVSFLTPLISRKVRVNTRLNGERLGRRDHTRFARQVVGAFFDFVCEVAHSAGATKMSLRAQVLSIEGADAYLQTRQSKRGAVLVTAHMGSFEIGLSALTDVEPKIRVVFKRDAQSGFEAMRRSLRERLDVAECAIDDGWPALVVLRDALDADEVVVMQADRAMPGQKSQVVPFAGGTLRLPVGPVTLARINGSPIVPVFAVREARGRFRVYLEPAIDPAAHDAVERVARAIEKFVTRDPAQWLVLDAAFVEDASRGIG